jgi:hypothetical protein
MSTFASEKPMEASSGSPVSTVSLRKVGYIALNTFRETVRDKVLYNLVLFALVMIASSYLLGKISVNQEIKIIKDLGLASISIFGMAIAIFIGIGLVSKEIDKRTLYRVSSPSRSRGSSSCWESISASASRFWSTCW